MALEQKHVDLKTELVIMCLCDVGNSSKSEIGRQHWLISLT